MTSNNLCSSCTNIGCEFQSGIVRTKCAFYMPPHIEPDNSGNYVVMQSTYGNGELPNDGWIPVSERLPETTDKVLVSDSYRDVFVAWCQNRGGSRWWNSEDMTYSMGVPILAWMPLPKPYKAESEGKE